MRKGQEREVDQSLGQHTRWPSRSNSPRSAERRWRSTRTYVIAVLHSALTGEDAAGQQNFRAITGAAKWPLRVFAGGLLTGHDGCRTKRLP
jgi:hypothetical protein